MQLSSETHAHASDHGGKAFRMIECSQLSKDIHLLILRQCVSSSGVPREPFRARTFHPLHLQPAQLVESRCAVRSGWHPGHTVQCTHRRQGTHCVFCVVWLKLPAIGVGVGWGPFTGSNRVWRLCGAGLKKSAVFKIHT